MIKKEQLIKEALTLTVKERADIIEKLLQSLDRPDQEIDELWKKEAESRIDAYEKGAISSVSVEEAISKYKSE